MRDGSSCNQPSHISFVTDPCASSHCTMALMQWFLVRPSLAQGLLCDGSLCSQPLHNGSRATGCSASNHCVMDPRATSLCTMALVMGPCASNPCTMALMQWLLVQPSLARGLLCDGSLCNDCTAAVVRWILVQPTLAQQLSCDGSLCKQSLHNCCHAVAPRATQPLHDDTYVMDPRASNPCTTALT